MSLLKTLVLFTVYALAIHFAQAQDEFFRPVREGNSSYKTAKKSSEIIPLIKLDDSLKKIDVILEKTFSNEWGVEDILIETTKQFSGLLKTCKNSQRCKEKHLENLFYLARHHNRIDDTFLFLITKYIDKKEEVIPFVEYLYKLDSTNKIREEKNQDTSVVTENLFLNEARFHLKVKKIGRLTPRQRLFILYSEQEIELLAQILEKFLSRNFSLESSLVFKVSETETESIPLSETEKYNAAVKLLNRDLARAFTDNKFSRPPMYADLLAAGLETGVISNEMLNELIKIEKLQDPYTSGWEKAGKIALRIGKTVLTVNPVTGIYAMSAFLVIESIQQIKAENEKVSDDHLF